MGLRVLGFIGFLGFRVLGFLGFSCQAPLGLLPGALRRLPQPRGATVYHLIQVRGLLRLILES